MKRKDSLPGIVEDDPYLAPYVDRIRSRLNRFRDKREQLSDRAGFGHAHRYFGLHAEKGALVIREWAPNASEIFLLCDLTQWRPSADFRFSKINEHGDWEIRLPEGRLNHGDGYRLLIRWPGGEGERIPAYVRRVVQDPQTWVFSAQVWNPPETYDWKHPQPTTADVPLVVYEAHIGIAGEEGGICGFEEFRLNVLPRIAAAGFNTLQLMALMEHPYYGSFGYQVSSFFALSSRYGTPEQFKALVDECHRAGIRVIMDIVHSHAVKNEVEGIGRQDGTGYLYGHEGPRGHHPAWDSRCFDYGKDNVLNFLLSNCAFWMEEYLLDGFRFDGVTSMLYHDHGLGKVFDHYDQYFGDNVDDDAVLYLTLANHLIHRLHPGAVTIAEDMSGFPGIAASSEKGGCGFDYRLAMGIPDYWIKLIKHVKDEEWSVGQIWETLNNRRLSERHIAYAESHDQALVGDKTILFRLVDAAMYTEMAKGTDSHTVRRGIDLYKLINLLTFSLGGDGFMNFMGNEFGHPEWIDFPREGNDWSYHYARRQWSLVDNPELRYRRILGFSTDLITNCAESLATVFSELILLHEEDGIIFYRRGGFFYLVNLNPARSFTDYGLPVTEGEYRLVLNTDSGKYDGLGRIEDELTLAPEIRADGTLMIAVDIPSRTGMVFRKSAK
ncbi:MAG: 1,4-alpha-glucan-branching enzyme [Proteobacteria bacterium]|nr:1,4-alpha-glucan-branching enzyme [Pseudomonadota bacterium]